MTTRLRDLSDDERMGLALRLATRTITAADVALLARPDRPPRAVHPGRRRTLRIAAVVTAIGLMLAAAAWLGLRQRDDAGRVDWAGFTIVICVPVVLALPFVIMAHRHGGPYAHPVPAQGVLAPFVLAPFALAPPSAVLTARQRWLITAQIIRGRRVDPTLLPVTRAHATRSAELDRWTLADVPTVLVVPLVLVAIRDGSWYFWACAVWWAGGSVGILFRGYRGRRARTFVSRHGRLGPTRHDASRQDLVL